MINKKTLVVTLICAAVSILMLSEGIAGAQAPLTPQEQLGRLIFFDTNLSEPAGQGCVSCHDPSAAFAEPDKSLPVSEGVIPGRFGTRNSPSAAYAVFFPEFDPQKAIGGQFWDGRAANLTEQAKGPFLNPVEMNNPDKATVIAKIQASTYANLFEQVYGPDAFADVDVAYHNMAAAIAAFEGTRELNQFTSKFDYYQMGLVALTPEEEAGRQLFSGRAKCGHCHPAKAQQNDPILFTDFEYHNIGLPKNEEFPFDLLPPDFVDLGLGVTLDDARENGKFKTSHLRNIELTGPYMHNGVLKTLKEVVHFYNTRDVPGEWPPPEVPENLDSKFIGDLGLTDAEEDLIVAFMLTFNDRYILPE